MRQFLDVKDQYPEAIVFFRLGDFYEMFFEDAVVAARALDLTLTTRDKGREDAIPMCGVPHHAARGYIARLTELGHKVVLVEQVEDPRHAKGLVKREVVRVVTPGVMLDDEVLEPKSARYLAAIAPDLGGWGLAYLDVTTGEFRATTVPSTAALADELARVAPREVLATQPLAIKLPWTQVMLPEAKAARETVADLHAQVGEAAAIAAAAVLEYARATQPTGALPVTRLQAYEAGASVVLDEAAIANLELVQTLIGGKKQGSLLDVIDETRTAPGGRMLRRWLLYPLTEVAAIRRRHDAVEWLAERPALLEALRRELAEVHDLERLAGKATLGVATPRDLARLRDAIAALPGLVARLTEDGVLGGTPALLDLAPVSTPALAELAALLGEALVDEPPAIARDGGFVRTGWDPEVDAARGLADGGKDAILAIETRERERAGIASLKVRYNRVFGYYIEITKSHLARVPQDYIRKQTIAGGERYVTPELADLEARILGAQETLLDREGAILRELIAKVAALAPAIAAAGAAVAAVDVLAAYADVARRRGYARPTIDDGTILEILDGRHPVIEAMLPDGSFVPNDCRLDAAAEQILLITGPNMAGKSTYMRQVAHIVLLAQAGCFVPARAATIGVCDRVYTRVGAADNLSRGDSTFMVEMRETAAILAGATRRSLVLLDEVGRGTSTFDGVSIAWAVAEHLHDAIGARTLFATHYHELCALQRPRIRNISVAVREHQGEIVFLRRVVEGGASRSYGIDVARLAGLPRGVITRARALLANLEGDRIAASPQLQLSLTTSAPAGPPSELADRLRALDPDHLTPMQALAALAELRTLV